MIFLVEVEHCHLKAGFTQIFYLNIVEILAHCLTDVIFTSGANFLPKGPNSLTILTGKSFQELATLQEDAM
jgi:hypothetical protein